MNGDRFWVYWGLIFVKGPIIIFLFIEETVFILVVNNKKIFPSNRFETQIKLNTILTLVTKHLLTTNKNNLKAYISRSFRET